MKNISAVFVIPILILRWDGFICKQSLPHKTIPTKFKWHLHISCLLALLGGEKTTPDGYGLLYWGFVAKAKTLKIAGSPEMRVK